MTSTLLGLDTRLLYTGLVALVAVERLLELRLASRNLRRARDAGGVEAGAGHYPVMVALHTLLLASCVAEVWLVGRPFVPWLALAMLGLLAGAALIRFWVISTLGPAWTTRVIVVPGRPLATGGPYRFLSHPNYLAVVLEVAALPLVHTAYLTAAVFTAANGALLAVRIRAEEAALERGRARHRGRAPEPGAGAAGPGAARDPATPDGAGTP